MIDDPIADAHRRGLLATCDVVLSLHRAGTFNPRIAEAMLMKRPIVATGYGRITDLLNETTGYPVPWRKTRLQRAMGPYPAGAISSEPDPEAAASIVLSIAGDPESARARAAEARRHALARHSLDAMQRQLDAELERLLRSAASLLRTPPLGILSGHEETTTDEIFCGRRSRLCRRPCTLGMPTGTADSTSPGLGFQSRA